MREREAVNGSRDGFRSWVAEIPPGSAMFALRYGKICDDSPLDTIILHETARVRP